ncbi:brain-enriched guanylate kinase-associated protein [Lasius niger]|uniref:Brain-enriched guanylate kinase-associated protein n=1 Tax=Lasius niger TaxID=67767 RepID=A0A0J7P3Y4_LASNI|nr:brain-enriched guanylate kinase-associated protein [Lasius niger]
METQFLNEADKFPNGELASMKEELLIWQEKYSRLHEAHKRVQKVNQNLEDKLLRIVDKCETEKGTFTKDIATLSHRLADANYTIHQLTQDNEKYRNDVSLAIQLLQCKPSNFVGQKYDSLPSEVQAKVRTYVAQKRCSTQDVTQPDVKSITVPISTFPPTAMVYNITKPAVEKHSDDDSDEIKPPMDIVSAAIMAKVLEDREKERIFAKHCDTCTCHRSILMVNAETQTCVPDVFSFSDGHTRSVEKQASEGTANGEKHQSKGKLQSNLASHAIFYEINENSDKICHHVNGDYTIFVSQAPSIKEKFISRTMQDCMTEENCATTKKCSNKKNSSQSHENKHSSLFPRSNDLNRINIDKAKPLKGNNKKCDSPIETRSIVKWNKDEGNSFVPLLDTVSTPADNRFSDKEQTHIDIINDRLWKNEWTRLKTSEVNISMENKCKANRGIELDIINDRDWKNDKSAEARNAVAQFTLIEVKSPDNSAANHNDGSQMEVATSPSFSSDSMVISSSDPSSSCSDVTQSLTGGTFNSSTKSNSSRVIGPRNCLVRVTPGSKNILLDNAGHFKTVLYSNGGGKASTALVHAKKTSRAGSEHSVSTNSEDNSPPVLLQDNQLQRVAEWVQSSIDVSRQSTCMENSASHDSNKTKCEENTASNVYPNNCLKKSSKQDGTLACKIRDASKKSLINVEDCSERIMENEPNNINILSKRMEQDKSENLITFDVLDERSLTECHKNNLDYEVKITKEMEETYLKLAASLDPVALSLSSASDAELTIEKYRKDYKRLHVQRFQDKTSSKA